MPSRLGPWRGMAIWEDSSRRSRMRDRRASKVAIICCADHLADVADVTKDKGVYLCFVLCAISSLELPEVHAVY